MSKLEGKIVVVTGATRSIGRGIAVVLGQEGATVYVTGRSIRGDFSAPTKQELQQNDATIEGTAELVTQHGGKGIPVRCDHTIDEQVEALFNRVKGEQGHLDILVNNVWGGYENVQDWGRPFWEQPLWRWDVMFTAGLRAHYTASRLAVPLMLPAGQGLIVSTTFWDRDKYLSPLPYDIVKTAINRMVYGMGHELREHHIAAIALSPGVPRNEFMITRDELEQEYRVDNEKSIRSHWPEDSFLWKTESTQYIGRAIVALATDYKIMDKTGSTLTVGDLAREYGFVDIDDRQPSAYRIDERN